MNVGQFTLPVLFVRHGWSAVVLIVIGSMLCAHTALLMADSLVQFTWHVPSIILTFVVIPQCLEESAEEHRTHITRFGRTCMERYR